MEKQKISAGLKKKRGTKGRVVAKEQIAQEEKSNYLSYYKKAKHRLPKKDILNKRELENVLAVEAAKGRVSTPADIVRRQVQDDLTDKQVSSRWEVYKREFPGKYRNKGEFIRGKGWKEIDDVVYQRVKAEMESESGGPVSDELVYRRIYSPGL